MEVLVKFEKVSCGTCGVLFAIEENHKNALIKTNSGFYCPNGHEGRYNKKEKGA